MGADHPDREDVLADVGGVQRLGETEIRARNLALLTKAPLFDIEIASACNVHCSFCPRDEMVRERALMDDPTFDALLDFLPDGAIAMLSGLGDTLVHPKAAQFVARLTERGVSTCVITNGVGLTPSRQDELIKAGVAEIQVSVHGLDDVTVRSVVPRGARPSTVRAHVERLGEIRGPRIRINFVETDENAHAREAVERWAEQLGARFFHRRQHTRGGAVGTARPEAQSPGCGIFGTVTFISSDGEVLPCVNDVQGEGRFGSVHETSWAEVLVWKRNVIGEARWFARCHDCDDDYRWVLLARGGLDGA